MNVKVSIETTALFRDKFGPKADKRLAYAVVNALNATAKRIQVAMRDKVTGDFTVRQRAFIARQVAKIDRSNFANVRAGRAWVEVAVGKKPNLLLAGFEHGGDVPAWTSTVAKGFTPVPVIGGPARLSKGARTPRKYKLRNLDFVETTTRTGKSAIASSDASMYVVPGVGIFERKMTGFGSGSRLVYFFHPNLSLDQRLEFVKTGTAVAEKWFGEELERATIESLKFAGLT